MKLTCIAVTVGLALVLAGCLDFEEAKTCTADSDCLEGRFCDQAKKVCVDGARDAGFVSDVGADVASAPDAADTGADSVADAGLDAALDSGFDSSHPSDASFDGAQDGSDDVSDAGVDAGGDATVEDTGATDAADAGTQDVGEDAALSDAGVDAAEDTGQDTGPDAGEDAGADTGIGDVGADAGVVDGGCVPDCTGKERGDNGCSGSCGGCGSPPASTCPDVNTIWEHNPVGNCAVDQCDYLYNDRTCQYGCANGTCSNCTPDCTNKNCGLDGCGGSCGNCTTCLNVCDTGVCAAAHHSFSACDTGDVWWFDSCSVKEEMKTDCTVGQVCYNNACCTPSCAGKCGGVDSCGGTCPDNCVAPQTCGGGGTTNVCGCTPGCAGKCGGASDGCTGTCPDPCNSHGSCSAGVCTCNTGYTGAACDSCDTGYSGYPTCVPSGCGTTASRAAPPCLRRGQHVQCGRLRRRQFTGKTISRGASSSRRPTARMTSASAPPVSPRLRRPDVQRADHFILPDTDQRACYDNTTTMTYCVPVCADGTPNFCGQDWQRGWDTTHAQTAGTQRRRPSREPLVADNLTEP